MPDVCFGKFILDRLCLKKKTYRAICNGFLDQVRLGGWQLIRYGQTQKHVNQDIKVLCICFKNKNLRI